MKRVIITGASGFIGRALTREFLDSGADVWAVVRERDSLDGLDSERLRIVLAAFEEYAALPMLIEERGFDAFFHFAWAGYGSQTNDIMVQTANIIQSSQAATAAAELKVDRFVFADSSHEYLTSKSRGKGDSLCSIYGAAKRSAQQMCRVICGNHGIDFIGVLFTNIFGVGDRSSRSTNTFLRRLLSGQDLDLIEGDNLYDWTYIDDCIRGVLAAAELGKHGKVYYVGSEKLRPFSEIIREVRDAVNPKAKLNFGRYQDNTYIDYRQIDIYELYRDTGCLPVCEFRTSVMKTADWMRTLDTEGRGDRYA